MIDAYGYQQVLKSTAATIPVTFYSDGAAVDPGSVTYAVTRANGDALTSGTASGTGAAARTFVLTAAQTASLDLLTVTWTGTVSGQATTVTTTVEIVGAVLFTVAEARAFDKQQLASSAAYPAADIEAARARITDMFESICCVSFVPRYKRLIVDGTGTDALTLAHPYVTSIRAAALRSPGTSTWTAFTAAQLADLLVDHGGYLLRDSLGEWTEGRRTVRLEYEHGMARPPEDVRRAALKLLAHQAVPSNLPERARSMTDELGTFSLATPGMGGSITGIPEVDEVLKRHSWCYPRIV